LITGSHLLGQSIARSLRLSAGTHSIQAGTLMTDPYSFSSYNSGSSPSGMGRREALPREFSDEDRMLDGQLANLAGETSMPFGLADRVFAASRRELTAVADGKPDLQQSPVLVRLPRRVGGHLATAAAVGLVALVTWWSTWQGVQHQPGSREAVVLPAGPGETSMVRDVAWHSADQLDAAFDRISSYVVAVEEIRSSADVETELIGLFPELVRADSRPQGNGR